MFCKHNYQYTQGHFYCTKCGRRTYGQHTSRRTNKRWIWIGIVVIVIFIIGIIIQQNGIDFFTNLSQTQKNDSTTFSNSEDFDVIKSGCTMSSNGIGDIIVNCSDGGNYQCKSNSPVKSLMQKAGITQDVTIRIADKTCQVEYVDNNGKRVLKSFTLVSDVLGDQNNKLQTESKISGSKEKPSPETQIPKIISKPLSEIVSEPRQLLSEINNPQQTSKADSMKAIDYINTIRIANRQKQISFDDRVFEVALARAKDNYDNDYFDHTNPKTGTCAYTIKSQFGLGSNEDVAENLYMETYGNSPSINNPSLTSVIDSWMGDFGHKHNLLFPDHVSGAVACYGGICAFEGLNYQEFGHGCYTASQGQAQFGKLDNCSEKQVNEYLALEKKLDEMKPQVEKIPKVATSQEQYNYYNQIITQYNNLVNQINNFSC